MSDKSKSFTRREFIGKSSKLAMGIVGAASVVLPAQQAFGRQSFSEGSMKFGLVTYLWGKNWELPQLIRNCQRAGVYGVELRVNHAHGVSPELSSRERKEVRMRFEDSPVELVGFGTNYAFHYTDKGELQESLGEAKKYVRLSHDLGSSGVKVKPNGLPESVPEEQTIEQIGESLNELGRYAAGFGQEIRVEVHGNGTSRLPVIARIFEVVDQPSVGVCWNCNKTDLEGEGLEYNFNLVKDDFSQIVHIHKLDNGVWGGIYPYQKFFNLLVDMNYEGWILLEAATSPDEGDRIKGLQKQKRLFEKMISIS